MPWDVKFLPTSSCITDATELAFLNGVPFVIASKHEQTVEKHCADRDRWKAAAEGWLAQTDREVALREEIKAENERLRDELQVLMDACGHCLAAGRPPNEQMIGNARAALSREERQT